jgi:hypothetical protein
MKFNPWFVQRSCDIESYPWFLAVADTPTKMNSNSLAMSAPAAAVSAAADAGGEHEEQQEAGHGEEGDGSPKQAVNLGEDEKTESGPVTAPPIVARGFQERLRLLLWSSISFGERNGRKRQEDREAKQTGSTFPFLSLSMFCRFIIEKTLAILT